MGRYPNLPADLHRLVSDDGAWALDHTAYSGSRDRLWRGKYELLAYHDGAWEVRIAHTVVAQGQAPGMTGLCYRARAAALRVLAAYEAIDRDAGGTA